MGLKLQLESETGVYLGLYNVQNFKGDYAGLYSIIKSLSRLNIRFRWGGHCHYWRKKEPSRTATSQ